jgi:tetratricopeptide (TPR) repeat protein
MDQTLLESLIVRTPYPISIKLVAAREAVARNQWEMVGRYLQEAAAALIRVIAAVSVADTVSRSSSSAHLLLNNLFHTFSIHDHISLPSQLLQRAIDDQDELFFPELCTFFLQNHGNHIGQERLKELLSTAQHMGQPGLTVAQSEALGESTLACAAAIINDLAFLWANPWLLLGRFEEEIYVRNAIGPEFHLVSNPLPADVIQHEGLVAIVPWEHPERWLSLSPFCVYRFNHLENHVEFFMTEGATRSRNKLRTVLYTNYTSSGRLSVELSDPVFGWVFKDLSYVLREAYRNRPDPEYKRVQDYYYTSQDTLIDALYSNYIPRQEVDDALNTFFKTHQSGLFVLEGIPGSGKSAWMARVAMEMATAYHFASKNSGRDSVVGMVQSLFQQIAEAFSFEIMVPEKPEVLYREFNNLLTEVSLRATTPVLIVIDAADELRFDSILESLNFLPEVLPDHVYVLLSTRPFGPQLPQIYSRSTVTLSPMSQTQVEFMIRAFSISSSPELIARSYEVSNGNPLILRWYLAAYSQNPEVSFKKVASLDLYYAQALTALQQDPEGDTIFAILATLAVAREPLSIGALMKLVGIKQRALWGLIKKTRGFLSAAGNKVLLCHKTLVDYLLNDENDSALSGDEIREAHACLIENREASEELAAYFLAHGSYHLYMSNKLEEIPILLESLDNAFGMACSMLLLDLLQEQPFLKPGGQIGYLLKLMATSATDASLTVLSRLISLLIDYSMFDSASYVKGLLTEDNLNFRWLGLLTDLRLARMTGQPKRVVALGAVLLTNDFLPQQVEYVAHHYYADGLREQGNHQEAIANYNKAAALVNRDDDPTTWLQITCALADMEYVYGYLEEGRSRLLDALAFADRQQLAMFRASIQRLLGQIDHVLDRFEPAIEYFKHSLELSLRLKRPYSIVEAYNSLAEAQRFIAPLAAIEHAHLARKKASEVNAMLELGKSYYIEADIHNCRNDYTQGEAAARQALEVLEQVGYGSGVAHTKTSLGYALLGQGKTEEALDLLIAALKYYQREQIYPSLRIQVYNLLMQAAAGLMRQNELAGLEQVAAIPNIRNFPNVQILLDRYGPAGSA